MAAGERGAARYEVHPQEADIVRRVFTLYVDEGLSIGAIARALTADEDVSEVLVCYALRVYESPSTLQPNRVTS